MQKLKKIDEQTNILTFFEIPVTDIDKAKKFYETILGIEMLKNMEPIRDYDRSSQVSCFWRKLK